MDDLTRDIQCEEAYGSVPITQITKYKVLLTENKVIFGMLVDDKLVSASGYVAKVEQIEMNCVQITKGDHVMYAELNDDVRWLPENEKEVQ